MGVQAARHVFTVDEYHRMAQGGVFTEDDRLELIEGEIIEMVPIGSRHAATVDRLTRLLSERASRRAIVRVQSPIRLGEHSEPQPDLTLLRPRDDFYASGHPGPADIFLVVEVVESSERYDREVKLPLYARYGVPEVWLVDLERGVVDAYREPYHEGYRGVETFSGGDCLSLKSIPRFEISVEEVLGTS